MRFQVLRRMGRRDFAELHRTMGFPSVQNGVHFCPLCNATKDNAHERYEQRSLFNNLWGSKNLERYLLACNARRITVEMRDRADILEIVRDGRLTPMTGRGFWGGTLQVGLPRCGLTARDRLEPGSDVSDVMRVEQLAPSAHAPLRCVCFGEQGLGPTKCCSMPSCPNIRCLTRGRDCPFKTFALMYYT
eukprot:8804189-Pyramimonas_sp.AAC.1